MSEERILKGMRCYAVADKNEDGSYFIKKSEKDGSLAIFDERHDAVSEAENHPHNPTLEVVYLVRESRFIESNNSHDKLVDRVKELEAFVELVANAKLEREEVDIEFVGVCDIEFISSSYKHKAKQLLTEGK